MKQRVHIAFLLCSSVLSALALAAESASIGSANTAQLQSIVDQTATAAGAVGAQVSVIVGDQRADFVYGNANTELNLPMTVDTVMQIGSTTKVFNAALMMTLVEEGKLELDAPIASFVPDLDLPDKQAQSTITLRQLLSMSSGLDNGAHAPFLTGEDALAKYVASLRTLPQEFAPGKGFGYSNAGICITGYAAQRVTGWSWESLLQKRILDPAGLRNAVTLPQGYPYQRISLGYTPVPGGKSAMVNRPWAPSQGEAPAGGTLMMSAHDLASFGQLFINGGKAANGDRVLSENALAQMMTPTTDVPMAMPTWGVGSKWGLGPNMSKWGQTVVWGHAGGNQNGMSQLIWIPEKRAVLAFVLNTPAALDPFSVRMFGEFSQAVFGISGPTVTAPEPALRVKNPKRFVGNYTRLGMRYEITQEGGKFRYKQINLGGLVPAELMPLGVLMDAELVSLGGDRFLARFPGQAGGMPIGFFGNDEQGRAANLVDPMFAARRVP